MLKSCFVIIFYFIFSKNKIDINRSTSHSFIVWPWHIDFNFHVNNAYFLNFANKSRLEHLAQQGILPYLLKSKFQGVISKNKIEYKKPLRLFSYFKINTQISSLTKKEIVFKHTFYKNEVEIAQCDSHVRLISQGRSINLDNKIKALLNEKE